MNARRIVNACAVIACIAACTAEQETDLRVADDRAPVRSNDPALVVGKTWEWVATQTPVELIEANDPARYTVTLGDDGRARVRFDCNTGGGGYEIAEGRLTFGDLISTRMACPPDSQDAVFARQLAAVRIFFVEGGELYLDLFADGGTMRFRAAGED